MTTSTELPWAAPTAGAPWAAPSARGPVRATVAMPGSKSITNRALLLAALAGTGGTLRGALRSRDTELMIAALRALGVQVAGEQVAGEQMSGWGDELAVAAHNGLRGPATVDCGLAGTVMRFVPPLAALADGPVLFDGDERARQRPMSVMLGALRAMGCRVEGDGLPFVLHGTGGFAGGAVRIDASTSSQFVSGLLLSAAGYDAGITVRHEGPPVPSLPHIEMTVQMLTERGVEVDTDGATWWRVAPGPVAGGDYDIEPDLSNATVFLAAAAATGGQVSVPGWPRHTTQAGDAIRPLLVAMGCRVDLDEHGLTVTGPGQLGGLDADLHDIGELTPTVAALAALAAGPSRLRGITHLRGHETDRLSALATELNALGGDVRETPDGLEIRPRVLRADPGRSWGAYADHRMATAGAIVGLVVPGIAVDDITATAKTLPDFVVNWSAMLAGGAC